MKEKIKIVIADNSKSALACAKFMLKQDRNLMLIGQAENGEELLNLLGDVSPHVILLDLDMPKLSGEETLKILVKEYPDIKVIMYSMYFEEALIEKLITMGAMGYVPKGSEDEILLPTIYAVCRNQLCPNKDIAANLINKLKTFGTKHFANECKLSKREIELIHLIFTCKGHKEIASELGISLRGVETLKTNIYKKTGVYNSSGLIIYGLKKGLFRV